MACVSPNAFCLQQIPASASDARKSWARLSGKAPEPRRDPAVCAIRRSWGSRSEPVSDSAHRSRSSPSEPVSAAAQPSVGRRAHSRRTSAYLRRSSRARYMNRQPPPRRWIMLSKPLSSRSVAAPCGLNANPRAKSAGVAYTRQLAS